MDDDIANNIELKPILIGLIISVIIMLIGFLASIGFLGIFSAIIGSAVAGFLTKNSTKYSLIYGAIIGIVTSFFMLNGFSIPIFLILGVFGGFIGKVFQSNLK